MSRRAVVESRRDRKALVADAGLGQTSMLSIVAGVLVAYGAFAVLASLAAAVLQGLDSGTDLGAGWRDVGIAGGLVLAAILFLSYLFGGYVAGRMARRAGSTHGVGVFGLGILIMVGVAAAVALLGGSDDILGRLRDLGLPTTAGEWGDIGTVAGLASLAAIFAGAWFGGMLGERWHAKLLTRAADPQIGVEADARRRVGETQTVAAGRHSQPVPRVPATNPSAAGAYTDGTRLAPSPRTAVLTADRGPERPYGAGDTRFVTRDRSAPAPPPPPPPRRG